ncbi:MAG: hypothetical protein IJT18_05325 [Oscillospiraceae bacterium]|nr:hypothetical protein [Oscillospiraceae bacterium]
MTSAKKRTLLMWGVYALLALLALLVQDTLLSRLPVAQVRLCLIPVTVACVAMQVGGESGALFALIVGAVWALSGVPDGGFRLLGLTVGGILSGGLCDTALNRRLSAALLLSAMTLVITETPPLVVRLLLYGGGGRDVALLARRLLLSLPLAVPMWLVCTRIRKAGERRWTD